MRIFPADRFAIPRFFLHAALLTALICFGLFPVYERTSHAPPGTVYPAVDGIMGDYYWYLSVMNQGRVQPYEINQYSTENAGGPSMVHAYYLLLGSIGHYTGLSNVVMYHLSVVVATVISYVSLVAISRALGFGGWEEFSVVGFVYLSSTFPQAVAWIFRQKPAITATAWTRFDPYFKLTQAPHHAIGIAFTLAAAAAYFRYLKTKRISWAIVSAGTIAFSNLFFSIPGSAFFAALLPFFCGSIPPVRRFFRRMPKQISGWMEPWMPEGIFRGNLVIFAVSVVTLVASYLQLRLLGFPWSEIIRWETIIFSVEWYPTMFPVLLAAIGIYWIFIIPMAVRILRKPSPQWMFILILFFIPFILYLLSAYKLVNLNKVRFVLMCLPFTTGLLSAGAVAEGGKHIRSSVVRAGFLAAALAVGVVIPFFNHLQYYWIPESKRTDYFSNMAIAMPYFHAMRYLESAGPRYTGILTSFASGTFLPSFSYLSVFIGHEVGTDQFWAKKAFTDMLYAGSAPRDLVVAVLKKNRLSYLLWDVTGDPVQLYPGIFEGPVFTDSFVRVYRILPQR